MRICVIFNPVARGEKARRFRRHLDSIARESALKATVAPGHARTLAAEAVRDGYDTVVAAGGDGTVNEVINGFGDVAGGFARARLGILPLGTINVFARELRLPLNLMAAWRVIQAGRTVAVDLPWAEFMVDGRAERRHFAQLGGAGLDSRAISLVDRELKKKYGPLAYVLAGFKALREPPAPVDVTDGAGTWRGELVLFGNGRFYGGTFRVFRNARLQDGRLHLCVFPKVNWAVLGRALCGLAVGRLARACGAAEIAVTSVTLSSPVPVWLELDGDNVGHLPAKLGVIPQGLRVMAPASEP
jgi:YegS/Rv2252/BmrU family lipid kinase